MLGHSGGVLVIKKSIFPPHLDQCHNDLCADSPKFDFRFTHPGHFALYFSKQLRLPRGLEEAALGLL